MSIERANQYSAETQVVTDLFRLIGTDAATLTTVAAKTGNRSYLLEAGVGMFGCHFDAALSALRMGMWLRMSSGEAQDNAFLYHGGVGLSFSATGARLNVQIDTDAGTITVRRPNGATVNDDEILATAALPAAFGILNTFFAIGITHKIDSASGFLSVYVSNSHVISYTGDTRPSFWNGSSVEYVDEVSYALGPGTNDSSNDGFIEAYVDDLYIDSYVGEADLLVPSPGFLYTTSSGAGTDDEWTPSPGANWQNIDDVPNDGDTSTNRTTVIDQRDTFDFGNVTLPDNYSIVAVLPITFVRKVLVSPDALISLHAFDGVDYLDSDDLVPPDNYNIPVFARFETQPDSSAWDETSYNAMQFGYRSRGTI